MLYQFVEHKHLKADAQHSCCPRPVVSLGSPSTQDSPLLVFVNTRSRSIMEGVKDTQNYCGIYSPVHPSLSTLLIQLSSQIQEQESLEWKDTTNDKRWQKQDAHRNRSTQLVRCSFRIQVVIITITNELATIHLLKHSTTSYIDVAQLLLLLLYYYYITF